MTLKGDNHKTPDTIKIIDLKAENLKLRDMLGSLSNHIIVLQESLLDLVKATNTIYQIYADTMQSVIKETSNEAGIKETGSDST